MIDWPQCTFCKNEIESLEHLFYNCEITRSRWVALRSWLMECNISLEPLSIFNVSFGIFNAGEDFVIVNRLILVAKFYFYRCKLNGVKPAGLKNKNRYTIQKSEQHLCGIRQKSMTKMGRNQMLSPLNLFPPPPPRFSLCLSLLFVYFCCRVQFTY